MSLDRTWFSESYTPSGSAFSLKITDKIHSEQSKFQAIDIYQTETFGKLMVIDGCTMVTTRDNFFYHEMMTHPLLYSHNNPEHILIIGGGDCGTLQQVLKHPTTQSATQIDIDERVTALANIHFPELCTDNNDPRATILFEDGIDWVRKAQKNSLDIIIVDSTEPEGPGEVLFTDEFYRYCFNALKEDGILAIQSESPFYHVDLLSTLCHRFKKVGFKSTRLHHYPQPIYPSGWWSTLLANKNGEFTFRKQDAKQKSFATKYYNANIHESSQVLPEYLLKALPQLTQG
ncbi:polyamine aminopropyltransferase [Piscirickettsia salmonis]|uniref:polyamine aminopropyltransferase n=1 Tax=Piscirickettsia salmonis TaxID=1238 RepID=UPI0007C91D71|nr:Spermidine synthase [Piscirickettsiaceae bacterium NZ-RLO1]